MIYTMREGIIFDMDGVLINAMPFHVEAMKLAINEVTNHVINKKIVYNTTCFLIYFLSYVSVVITILPFMTH